MSSSCPYHFIPGAAAPDTHCMGGWVGPTVQLEATDMKKPLAPAGNPTVIPHPNQG
jgi:hypothetical protein